jgi:fluoride ion exporter CrcB/FEX
MNIGAIIVLGALGGVVRLMLSHFGLFGLLTVNLVGSLLLGAVVRWTARHGTPPWVADGVVAGFIGALTSFASLISTTQGLLSSRPFVAAAYLICSVAGAMVLVIIGSHTASLWPAPSKEQTEGYQQSSREEPEWPAPLYWNKMPSQTDRD